MSVARDGGRTGDELSSGEVAFDLPRLHAIATEEETSDEGFAPRVRSLLEACGAGIAVHVRLRGAGGRRLWRACLPVAAAAASAGGWCVVNARPDLARALGADAVQVGTPDLPVAAVRRLVGERLRIGASVHGSGAALRAARDGADFLVLGTIFPTPSHPGRSGAGVEAIAACRRALLEAGEARPIVAIGGIDAARAAEARAAGAAGVAARRAVWATEDPTAAALELLEAFRGGP